MVAQPVPFPVSGTPPVIGRRASARLRLAIPARLVSIYSTQNCILLDISRNGARIALANPIAENQSGVVEVAQLALFGAIVRAEHGVTGGANAMAFEEPISDADVIEVRRFAEGFEMRERMALRDMVRRWVAGEP